MYIWATLKAVLVKTCKETIAATVVLLHSSRMVSLPILFSGALFYAPPLLPRFLWGSKLWFLYGGRVSTKV